MFSKSKINDPLDPTADPEVGAPAAPAAAAPAPPPSPAGAPSSTGRQPKAAPTMISSDLTVRGDLETKGDMQIEGQVFGDIRSNHVTIGQNARIEGEIVAEDVVVSGMVRGRLRGNRVRLLSTARVDGDILHKNIAIESGAQFEGSVQRSDDPLSDAASARPAARGAATVSLGPTPLSEAVAPAPSASSSNDYDAGEPGPVSPTDVTRTI